MTTKYGRYGDVLFNQTDTNQAIFLGTVRLKDIWKYRKWNKVRWWVGTDVLTLFSYPVGKSKLKVILHRLKAKLVNPFFKENWFVSVKLLNEVPLNFKLKNMKVKIWKCEPTFKKVNPVVIGYYMPESTEFNDWVYGKDIIDRLKEFFKEKSVIFLRYDGKYPVEDFLGLIHAYIRPSRHDGTPRLNLLCELNNINYLWDNDFSELVDFINLQMKDKNAQVL